MHEYQDYLSHHGILGQRWGVRRFQNADGTLTEAGRKHYSKELENKVKKNWVKAHNNAAHRTASEYAKINSKKEYSGKINLNRPTELELKYIDEINKKWKELYKEEADKIFGDNPLWGEYPLAYLPAYSQFDIYSEKLRAMMG